MSIVLPLSAGREGIPFLFDAAKAKCKVAFDNPGGPTVWDHLRDDPDRYIYPAVKHGISWDIRGAPLDTPRDLPANISAGIADVAQRGDWNRSAPADFALPTEIWREVVARRTRYAEVRAKLANGEVREINDLITLNLDIRQFAQDVIERCEGPDLLRAFWKAIENVTVLDPTCGSLPRRRLARVPRLNGPFRAIIETFRETFARLHRECLRQFGKSLTVFDISAADGQVEGAFLAGACAWRTPW